MLDGDEGNTIESARIVVSTARQPGSSMSRRSTPTPWPSQARAAADEATSTTVQGSFEAQP